MIQDGRAIDRLYNQLDRLKRRATDIQAGVITDYQDYILGNYAQIRKAEVTLQVYLDQAGLSTQRRNKEQEDDDD